MKATNASTLQPLESETFWQEHYELQKSCGLTRAKYCRQNDLNYDRFSYWIKKQGVNQNNKLISIKLKPEGKVIESSILCALDLRGGHQLRIYDIETLNIILDRWS